MDRILIVGAHAMDAELMAGAIAVQAQHHGIPVFIAHLTRGERGHPTKPAQVFGQQLEQEMGAAAAALGVTHLWPGYLAPLTRSIQPVEWIMHFIQEKEITLVITHWSGSWHPSHGLTHWAVSEAIQRIPNCPAKLFFAENCEDLSGYEPSWFIPVDDVYEQWIGSLMSYELFRLSLPGNQGGNSIPYWSYYSSITRVRGFYVGLPRAQTLMGDDPLPPALNAVRLNPN